MATTLEYYRYASLATAAYVRVGTEPLTGARFAELAEAQKRFPALLAQYLFAPSEQYPNPSPWRIRYYYGGDRSGIQDKTGFAATLFERDGKKVLAIRGVEITESATEIKRDLLASSLGGIGMIGLAVNQVVDMINLIRRLYAPAGTNVAQIEASLTLTQPQNNFVSLQGELPGPYGVGIPATVYLSFGTYQGTGEGILNATDKITLTGHSLGGHLAVIASRLFPQLIDPDVFVFNSAGFDPVSWTIAGNLPAAGYLKYIDAAIGGIAAAAKGSLVESLGVDALLLTTEGQRASAQILDVLKRLIGTPVDAPAATLHNLASEDSAPGDDTSLVHSIFSGAQGLGEETLVTTEVNSHAIEQITDALALQATLLELEASLTAEQIDALIKTASNVPARSEERLIEALHRLLLPQGSVQQAGGSLPVSDASAGLDIWSGKGDLGARQAHYQALFDLRDKAASMRGDGHRLELTSSMTAGQLIDKARNGSDVLAYRYALQDLNPFVVPGNEALYAQHNADGELELYVPSQHGGSLTDEWLQDRAAFMAWANLAFTQDTDLVAQSGAPDQLFVDLGSGAKVFTTDSFHVDETDGSMPYPIDPRRFVFGRDGADFLVGGGKDDDLYGGAGDDLLEGAAGNDYLEGGVGLDVYQYRGTRVWTDQGYIDSNDGADTILDTDGQGVLRYVVRDSLDPYVQATVIADAGVRLSDTQWQSADGQFTYTEIPAADGRTDLRIDIGVAPGGTITLKDFREGDFGVHFGAARSEHAYPTAFNDIFGTDQSETLGGTAEADRILPGSGDDTVYAGGGDDFIVDVDGADFLYGEAGFDRLYGGPGRDRLYGGIDDDELHGGSDPDILEGGEGADRLEGDDGTDILLGQAGDDRIYAAAFVELPDAMRLDETGNASGLKGEWLDGGEGKDIVVGDNGNDQLLGGGDSDLLIGGAGDDNLVGDMETVLVDIDNWLVTREIVDSDGGRTYRLIYNADAQVTVSANGGADTLYGGGGADWIFGGAGDDFAHGGSGNDVVFGEAGADILIGAAGDDLLVGDDGAGPEPDGADYLDGGAGNDTLEGDGGDDFLYGGEGDDVLYGLAGADALFGAEGNDTLLGGDGEDLLSGGPGMDFLQGGAGKDTYLFNKGDGTETINDTPAGANDPEASVLVLGEGISRRDVKFRTGSLLIDLGSSDPADPDSPPHDLIHFEGFNPLDPYSTPVVSEIRFADGSSIRYGGILAQGFDIEGTESDDDGNANPVLVGTAVTDRIRGLGGGDELQGLAGDDVLDGGADDDRLFGGDGNDRLLGGDGDDQLLGDAGNDRLEGGAGRDALWGGAGDDDLAGGEGFDSLFGGEGNDIYLFDEGDTVFDVEGDSYIAFGAGVRADDLELRRQLINSSIVYQLKRSAAAGGDVYAEGMGITLGSDAQLAGFVFADGTVLDHEQLLRATLVDQRSLNGTDADELLEGYAGNDWLQGGGGSDMLFGYRGDDRLEGGAGDDRLEGGAGNDWLSGGDGADVLIGGIGDDRMSGGYGDDVYVFGRNAGHETVSDEGDPDSIDTIRIEAGVAPSDVALSRQPNGDLALTIIGGEADLIVSGYYLLAQNRIERIVFADGTVIGPDALDALVVPPILGTPDDDFLFGTPYNDTIQGLDGNDVLDGGPGADLLEGCAGIDAYVLSWGGGLDAVVEAAGGTSIVLLSPEMRFDFIESSMEQNDLIVRIAGSDDGLRIVNYFSIDHSWIAESPTGEQISLRQLLEDRAAPADGALASQYRAYHLAQVLDNFLSGRADVYEPQFQVSDTVSGDSLIFRQSPVLAYQGQTEILTLENVSGGPGNNIFDLRYSAPMQVDGGDGDDLIWAYGWGYGSAGNFMQGGAGNDRVFGTFGGDTLIADAGNDYLAGGDGDDSYVVLQSAGTRIIDEVVENIRLPEGYAWNSMGGRESADTIVFSTGIVLPDLEFSWGRYFSGSVDVTAGARYYDSLDISWGESDGVRILLPDVGNPYVSQFPGESYGIERYRFQDGAALSAEQMRTYVESRIGPMPTMFGTDVNDTITGTDSDDVIYGYGGSDALFGGAGADILDGGAADDWLFGEAGDDTLRGGPGADRLLGGEGADRLLGGNGDDILEGEQGGDLLQGGAGNDVLWAAVSTDFLLDAPGNTLQGGDGDDLLYGAIDRDILRGDAGNDRLFGQWGDDVLAGGAGSDYVSGGRGNDAIYVYYEEPGLDVIDETSPFALINGIGTPNGGDAGSTDTVFLGPGIKLGQLSLGYGSFNDGALNPSAPSDYLTLEMRWAEDRGASVVLPNLDQPWVRAAYEQHLGGSYGVEFFTFSDGETVSLVDLLDGAPVRSVLGNEWGESLTGTLARDHIQGLAGDDSIDGLDGADILEGGDGSDYLIGGRGDDILRAGEGARETNRLEDVSGSNLFEGSSGADQLLGGPGRDLWLGRDGDDSIDLDVGSSGQRGTDLFLFNRGDGQDNVIAHGAAGAGGVLSLGGGVTYARLQLARDGDALTVKAGGPNRIVFADWYATPQNRVVDKLQVVIGGTRAYDPLSADPLADRKVQLFDFAGLVAAFDRAQAAGTRFSVADNLPGFHLWGSDTEAYGGAVAYQYGTNKTLDGLSDAQTQSVIRSTEFVVTPQAIDAAAPAVATAVVSADASSAAVATESGLMLNPPAKKVDPQFNPAPAETEPASPPAAADAAYPTQQSAADAEIRSRIGLRLAAWFTQQTESRDLGFHRQMAPSSNAASLAFTSDSPSLLEAAWSRMHLDLDFHFDAAEVAGGENPLAYRAPPTGAYANGLVREPADRSTKLRGLETFEGLREGFLRLG